MAVIEVSPLTVNEDAAVAPKFTAVRPVNPDPVIVTLVPPETGPLPGLTPVTVAATLGVTPAW